MGVYYYNTANKAFRKKDYPHAIRMYLLAVKEDPQDCSAHVNLALVYKVSGNQEAALHHIDQAISIDSNEDLVEKRAVILDPKNLIVHHEKGNGNEAKPSWLRRIFGC